MNSQTMTTEAGADFEPFRLRNPWSLHAIALACSLAALSTGAQALALGQARVLSSLGEPLRAEVEITQISDEEASSLKVGIAAASAFRAAGVDFNSALANTQTSLARRSDGRWFIRVQSERPVNEPFVDLILESTWATGRIVRDYTLLIDPPAARQSGSDLSTTAVTGQTPAVATPSSLTQTAPQTTTAARPIAGAASATKKAENDKPKAGASATESTVTVNRGDTAGKIAARVKPEGASLDQMLVALLRANPQAFIGGNVNRIRAGAVLDVPSSEQVTAIQTSEARRTVSLQARSFNDFRRTLAERTPVTAVEAAARTAAGAVQTQVDDKKSVAPAADKLTLSKGNVQGKSAEAEIASARQAKEASERAAELNRNIGELSRLKASTATVASPSASGPASAGKGPAVPLAAAVPAAAPASKPAIAGASSPTPAASAVAVSKPASAASASTPAAPAASVAAPKASAAASVAVGAASTPAATTAAATATTGLNAGTPSVTPTALASSATSTSSSIATGTPTSAAPAPAASAPAPAPIKKPAPPPPPPPPEPTFLESLLDNPFLAPLGGGLIALLGGFGFYRWRQTRKTGAVDSSFLESRLQPDSFFGSSGGQRIDTNEAATAASSMAYSPSQLDAAGDVDPVAEADVYLAYGRDLQAEEILKEALKLHPTRLAIHGKLLDIYAKRRDLKAFEALAVDVYKSTNGTGPDWERIAALGLEVDSSNPLYRPGGKPVGPAETAVDVESSFASSTIPVAVQTQPIATTNDSIDLDLGDLDFSGEHSFAASEAPVRSEQPPTVSLNVQAIQPLAVADVGSLDIGNSIEIPDLGVASAPPSKPAPATSTNDGMLEFDLGGLSLDLDSPASEAVAPTTAPTRAPAAAAPTTPIDIGGDAMETKLSLAQEFHAIGDTDAAKALVREVIAESSGSVKAKAQRFLADLG